MLKQIGGKTALGLVAGMIARAGLSRPAGGHGASSCPWPATTRSPPSPSCSPWGKPVEKRQALRYLADPKYMAANAAGAAAAIAQALRDPSEAVVVDAIAAYAAQCTEAQYFETLAPFLDGTSPNVVMAAVSGLAALRQRRASIEALDRKLLQGPTNVRLAVLGALEAIGTDAVVPSLAAALGHRTLNVRTRAAEILGRLSQERKIDISRTIV